MSETTCPQGHKVGTFYGRYKCTHKKCGEIKNREYGQGPSVSGQSTEPTIDLAKLRAAGSDPMLKADEVFIQKRRLAGMPSNLGLDDSIRWAEDALTAMVPEAVANLKWDMRYGDAKARSAAVERVLAAKGLSKREAVQQTGQTIIVNMGIAGENGSGAGWLDKFVNAKVIKGRAEPQPTPELDEGEGDEP